MFEKNGVLETGVIFEKTGTLEIGKKTGVLETGVIFEKTVVPAVAFPLPLVNSGHVRLNMCSLSLHCTCIIILSLFGYCCSVSPDISAMSQPVSILLALPRTFLFSPDIHYVSASVYVVNTAQGLPALS